MNAGVLHLHEICHLIKNQIIMIKHIFISTLFLLNTGLLFAQQSINSQESSVSFEISNMGYKTVEGSFSGMEGTIQFDTQNLKASHFNVCIATASIDTDNKMRDKHLRAPDYFHVEKHPNICFQSENIIKTDKGFRAEGTLTIKGAKKKTHLDFSYADNTFKSTLIVDRTDFGVGSNGSFMVGKEVTIHISCSLIE